MTEPAPPPAKPGKRLLSAIRDAAAHARGESVDGLVQHDFHVRQSGDREVITHYENGKRDPIKRIRRKDGKNND